MDVVGALPKLRAIRLFIAENFWVLEYVLKRIADVVGKVGDTVSGEAVSQTIT